MTWTDATSASSNTLHNTSRFVRLDDVADAQNGVDFVWLLRAINDSFPEYVSINSTSPLAITSGMSIP